jgi:hypothetical protein
VSRAIAVIAVMVFDSFLEGALVEARGRFQVVG